MSTKRIISTISAPAPAGCYSQAVASGPFIATAGFGPADPVTGRIPDGIEAQTRQVLDNLQSVLEEAGCSLTDVIKATVHLANLSDWAAFDNVYAEYFAPNTAPARTTVGSQLAGILVEIDVLAVHQS